jgi:hypothetical protein
MWLNFKLNLMYYRYVVVFETKIILTLYLNPDRKDQYSFCKMDPDQTSQKRLDPDLSSK